MNHRFHKIIFSQSQQQFVVVSELAKSSGKSSALPKAKVDELFSLLFDNIFSNSELHLQSQTWQNNQLQAGNLVTNSANGKLLLDATNVKAHRWEGEVQDFEAKSRQDVTKYSSEQVQTGGSVSVTYGSGGGATANAAYNSAKLNTAQVENQTSIDIGKGGMDIKVKNNAHFEGAVMTSQAEQENNRFQAGTLTTGDIENHSELKTRSAAISGGSGGVNPMSALSLLGNKNESERSTTRAAIGENIAINLTQDPNAETTLNNLNRDTQNANQKVTKHDIREAKETQELVKGIGEIAEKAFQIYTHSAREKVTEAKLEVGKVETRLRNEGKTKEEIAQNPEYLALKQDLNDKQQTFDNAYGTGSKTKRAVDAVTAALQGLAAKDAGQAAVGLASPYLNAEIKKYTEGDTQANLIAHALLGAVEAAATGNNVLAGAAAGAGSEAAADVIVKTLYKGKSTQDLTEAEKQNVTFLSQLAGGLASGIIGDSTQSAAVGADVGKRAVENNYLLVDYSQLKGLTKTDTEQGQRINEKLEKAGVENIDDYATQYRACGDNSSCQRQVIDAEMEAISRSYDIINELAKSGELSKNDIDFIQSTLVPRARGAYDSKTKDEATRVVYRSGDLETFAKSEHRLAEARFSAQLKLWVDQGLTDEQIQHKLENEPLAIALSTAGPNVGGRQPSGSGMGVPTFANARQTLLQIRALSKQASDFSVEVPSTVSAKDRQVTVTETVGYGKGTTNLRVSTGAENVALYPKLKDDLRSQQQAGFEKVIKDLNVKPQGSVLMLPDYRQKLAEAKSTLAPNLQERGNTKFNSLELPNKKGIPIDRKTDSEYKIFSNLADQIGSNTQAKGQVTIFTERPACPSCLGVAEQFNRRYPNIKVNIFDNNGNLIKP